MCYISYCEIICVFYFIHKSTVDVFHIHKTLTAEARVLIAKRLFLFLFLSVYLFVCKLFFNTETIKLILEQKHCLT